MHLCSHVGSRANIAQMLGALSFVDEPGQAEITNFAHIVMQKDVFRLDVSVDDFVSVQFLHIFIFYSKSLDDLPNVLEGFFRL